MLKKSAPSLRKKNEPSGELLFSVEHATVRHLQKTLFSSLTFQVRRGEQWALTGSSGSGKTALLHTILGHFNITNGERAYPFIPSFKKQHHISDPLFTFRNTIAFISQQARFKDKQNMQNFFYQQRYHSHFAEEAATVSTYLQEEQEKRKAHTKIPVKFSLDWVIARLQLDSLLPKTLIQLSNGETRRLQIANALLEQPEMLLMDNPFIGLDVKTRPILEDILAGVSRTGTAVIMATSSREIPDTITHIAHLQQMEIKYTGSKANFNTSSTGRKKSPDWQPKTAILEKINRLKPGRDHNFRIALKMEHIHVSSGGKKILKGIDWQVNKGEKWSLVGPNGAGKSTLLSLISGDHPQAYANRIYLFDRKRGSGESIWEVKKRIGFVSPEMHQYFKGNHSSTAVILSGLDDTMGFRNRKSDEDEIKLAGYWLQLLELEQLKDKPFRDIATGEQRLVLLLRAMIKNPPLLILDEPCQGLDEQQKDHFKHIINLLWNSKEKTMLYVSHYKEDIPSCVQHVLELEDGAERK